MEDAIEQERTPYHKTLNDILRQEKKPHDSDERRMNQKGQSKTLNDAIGQGFNRLEECCMQLDMKSQA